jgi:hypothetical protein
MDFVTGYRIGLQYGNLAKIVLTTCTLFFLIEVYYKC